MDLQAECFRQGQKRKVFLMWKLTRALAYERINGLWMVIRSIYPIAWRRRRRALEKSGLSLTLLWNLE